MFKICIVEDDLKTANTLKEIVSNAFLERGFETDIDNFYNAEDLLALNNIDYDIIFMDIELPKMNGMEAAKCLRDKGNESLVIFVTNLAQFAVNGYSVNAFDFIVKPLNACEFKLKIDRIIKALNLNKDIKLVVNASRNQYVINSKDILYVEVDKHNITYHTLQGNVKSVDSMKNVISKLNSDSFALCNQCYYVNLRYVKCVLNDIVVVRNEKLLISKPKRKEFIEKLNKYLRNGIKNSL